MIRRLHTIAYGFLGLLLVLTLYVPASAQDDAPEGFRSLFNGEDLSGYVSDMSDEEVAEATEAKVIAAPMMGGPFASHPQHGPMSKREPRAKDQSWTEKRPKKGQEG